MTQASRETRYWNERFRQAVWSFNAALAFLIVAALAFFVALVVVWFVPLAGAGTAGGGITFIGAAGMLLKFSREANSALDRAESMYNSPLTQQGRS